MPNRFAALFAIAFVAMAAPALAPTASAQGAAPSAAGAPLDTGPDFAGCVRSLNPQAEPEWTQTDLTLQRLIRTGLFDIRAAYRMHLCESELTVYVLQNAGDRSEVYECTSDDTYRAVFPCFRVGPEPQAP